MKRQVIFVLALCIITLLVVNKTMAVDSCLECHSNAAKMKELGFPQFTMTQQEVSKQTGMPATCTSCHFGDPADATKEGAHK